MRRVCTLAVLVLGFIVNASSVASAQPLGTFRWQLQPFCNVVALTITQSGGVFRLEGTDDQCGANGRPASAIGTAFFNADGSVALGLTLVTSPSGAPTHVMARLNIATLGGTWRDSDGHAGNVVFTPGAATGGSPRPPATGGIGAGPGLRVTGNPGDLRVDLATTSSGAFDFSNPSGLLSAPTVTLPGIPASGPGTRLMWYPRKGAFRAGVVFGTQWDDANIGADSAAMGVNTIAIGAASFAMGQDVAARGKASVGIGEQIESNGPWSVGMGLDIVAGGRASVAMGEGSRATGGRSLAVGSGVKALGESSVALGLLTTASSVGSVAIGVASEATGASTIALGNNVTASGSGGMAMGFRAVAAGEGSFAFGDRSTGANITAFNNQFAVRAVGGSGFYTRSDLTAGVELAPGASAWASVSDVNLKENFRDLDGVDVLSKIARMPIREWSYKAQDASIRHVGPTAQDFHAAFGLGEDPLKISTIDADGIALRAIQALEARTREEHERMLEDTQSLADTNDSLVRENADRIGEIAMLRAQLAALRGELAAMLSSAEAIGKARRGR